MINTLKLSGATVLRVHTSTLPAQCSIPPVNCIYTHSFDTFKSQVLRTYISSVLAIIRSLPADLRDYAKQSVPPQVSYCLTFRVKLQPSCCNSLWIFYFTACRTGTNLRSKQSVQCNSRIVCRGCVK